MIGRIAGFLAGASFCMLAPAIASGEEDGATRQEKIQQNRALQGPGVDVGKLAPDFELPLLDPVDLPKAEDGSERKAVRLSEYRSRKPVVLIFGSYT